MGEAAAKWQREYRASQQLVGKNGEWRESAYVSTQAALALERLANRYSVTKHGRRSEA